MTEKLIPPKRGERLYDERGLATLRHQRWLELSTQQINGIPADSGGGIDINPASGALSSILKQLDANTIQMLYNSGALSKINKALNDIEVQL